jgi:SP family sugar:H+ symporter-like MFS transporter
MLQGHRSPTHNDCVFDDLRSAAHGGIIHFRVNMIHLSHRSCKKSLLYYRRYSTYFFGLVGFTNAFVVTVIINACNISGTLSAFVLVRTVGRRLILIVGAAVCCFCMLAFSAIKQAAPNSIPAGKASIAFICMFCFTYNATWGSISPAVMGEVPSNRLRSKTVSIALASSWVVSLAVVTAVPYLLSAAYANLGAKVGFIFGALAVPVLIATILIVPETKGE